MSCTEFHWSADNVCPESCSKAGVILSRGGHVSMEIFLHNVDIAPLDSGSHEGNVSGLVWDCSGKHSRLECRGA